MSLRNFWETHPKHTYTLCFSFSSLLFKHRPGEDLSLQYATGDQNGHQNWHNLASLGALYHWNLYAEPDLTELVKECNIY